MSVKTFTHEGKTYSISDEADLLMPTIPTHVILAWYNATNNSHVARFATRGDGAKRLWKALTTPVKVVAANTTPKGVTTSSFEKAKDKAEGGTALERLVARGKAAEAKATERAAQKKPRVKREKTEGGGRKMTFALPFAGGEKPPREPGEGGKPSKRLIVFRLLSQPAGATFDELKKATDWDDKTCYEGVRLLHFYCGFGLKETAEGRIKLLKS